jgi:hypothetical protein
MSERIAKLMLLLALTAAPVFGQGCAMCYTSAKGAANDGQRALTRAVFTLLIPPVSMMGLIVGFAFLHNRSGQANANACETARDQLDAE